MKRNLIVGVLAAVFGLLLVSVWMFFEMRYSGFGVTMREWAATGRPTGRYDDALSFMGKWVLIHQFILSPIVSILIGLLVGTLCPRRYWLALIIGISPIIVMNYPSDVLSVMAGFVYIVVAWVGVKSAQPVAKHVSKFKMLTTQLGELMPGGRRFYPRRSGTTGLLTGMLAVFIIILICILIRAF